MGTVKPINRPDDELLLHAAPLEVWMAAEKQAKRSPLKRFRTGAVLFHISSNSIQAQGCSHSHNGGQRMASVHAERDVIQKAKKQKSLGGSVCLIVTLNQSGNYAYTSRPCLSCAKLLASNAWAVIYSQRANDGSWLVVSEDPRTLLQNIAPAGTFARDQRS